MDSISAKGEPARTNALEMSGVRDAKLNKLLIRRADLARDREILIEALSRHLNPMADARRFDWLYKKNPHGEALVWMAFDEENGEVVGSAAAFPRRVYLDTREETVWVLGDFCINSRYRSLGPAVQLQRACIAEVDAGRVAFCYDFPSIGMMAVYKRLGISPFARVLRLARPLRVDRQIEAMIKSPIVAAGVSAMGNLLLATRAFQPFRSGNVTVALHSGECGQEFSDLAREIGSRYGLCVQRSAEYLNWRYLANTYCTYEFITARREGKLMGYAAVGRDENESIIGDLFGIDSPAIIGRLVREVVAVCHRRQVHTVSLPAVESHPWLSLFRQFGFRERESKPMVVYPPKDDGRARSLENIPWFIMHGDRDS
jgi:hypothetical protein